MQKLGCRVDKHGKHGIKLVDGHLFKNSRDKDEKVVNPGNSHANRVIAAPPNTDLIKSIFHRVAQRENLEKAVRKDAVLLCEVTVWTGWDFFGLMDEIKAESFFEAVAAFLKQRYGADNCMYAVVHRDERAPHIHVGFVPFTDNNRLSAKLIITRNELCKLQSELPKYLSELGFQVEACRSDNEGKLESSGNKAAKNISRANAGAEDNSIDVNFAKMSAEMKREYQSLELEKILLERQLNGVIDIIRSDPQLELMYLRQVEKQIKNKKATQETRMLV